VFLGRGFSLLDDTRGARAKCPLSESDASAKALGYRQAAADVDQAKFPRFAAGQNCRNCTLYQGQGNDKWGGCAISPGKQVNAAGWCSAWAKKPG